MRWDRKIQDLRESLGMGVVQFARAVGVSRMTIFRWETGRETPNPLSRAALERLARETGRPLWKRE